MSEGGWGGGCGGGGGERGGWGGGGVEGGWVGGGGGGGGGGGYRTVAVCVGGTFWTVLLCLSCLPFWFSEVFPMQMEGVRLIGNKGLSNHFQVSKGQHFTVIGIHVIFSCFHAVD